MQSHKKYEMKNSTIPDWNGAVVVSGGLILRDYQIYGLIQPLCVQKTVDYGFSVDESIRIKSGNAASNLTPYQ